MMVARRIIALMLLALALGAIDRTIRIESPNGGEVLRSGSPTRILWRSLNVGGSVAILLFNNGEQYAVIAAAAQDRGVFEWEIPAALPDGGHYRLRICSLKDLRINDFSDRDFAIKK